ncbi:NAD(P)H-dependent oxidoreductase [Gilliamella sp. wkB112]|uniref:NAD(P)H-dependent oxidoreductase n=1 Tax=Gilliamella sp. wkB112 TaxID=3120257 RepID=UPI0009BDDB44|nr:NAD(P)H-dependent oxidoreductase [Gilliamella apicola]
MDKLAQAFDFRHACKKFDDTQKINQQDIEYILEAGRLSPSSFGMEPWHFIVVNNNELKKQLRTACYNQEQVTSCSHFVIVLYRKANNFTLQSDYLRRTIARTLPDATDQTAIDIACQAFINFYQQGLAEGLSINHWSEMQGYIASANMMTAAAYRGIDSCTIGGFEHSKLIQILENNIASFSKETFGVGLCLAFGYRVNEPGSHTRWPLTDVTTYLTESN